MGGSGRHFQICPPVDVPFPLLSELFSSAPVTFPGNNLLLCFGEARPLFLHSVLLMRVQGARRESSRKWEGASGAPSEPPRHFDVPGPSPAGSTWWGRGLRSLPIPPGNPAWHQLHPAVPRWEWVLQQRAFGRDQQSHGGTVLLGERQLSAGIVLLKGCWKQGEEVTCWGTFGDLPKGVWESRGRASWLAEQADSRRRRQVFV